MGVLNVTPDSFSDGGRYADAAAACAHAVAMLADGASIIDVGPESTRPGSLPVPDEEQIRRAVPVIRGIIAAQPRAGISIDTRSSRVAEAALDAGASMVNDVSALRDDPAMGPLIARRRVGVVLMHMQGRPQTMQQTPHYGDVVAEVAAFLDERAAAAETAGIARERIIVDPGIGFGKTTEHNVALLRRLEVIVELGYPVLVGASRKSFIGESTGVPEPAARLSGSLACAARALHAGAAIVRVHDVRETRQFLDMMEQIEPSSTPL